MQGAGQARSGSPHAVRGGFCARRRRGRGQRPRLGAKWRGRGARLAAGERSRVVRVNPTRPMYMYMSDRDMRGPHCPNPRQRPCAPAAFDASQACGLALAASYAQRCPTGSRDQCSRDPAEDQRQCRLRLQQLRGGAVRPCVRRPRPCGSKHPQVAPSRP